MSDITEQDPPEPSEDDYVDEPEQGASQDDEVTG